MEVHNGETMEFLYKVNGVIMPKETESITLKTKTIFIIIACLLGGGGVTGGGLAVFDFSTTEDVKKVTDQMISNENERHKVIDQKFSRQSADINGLKDTVTDVRATQIREIARQEARRLTEGIKNRQQREEEYDRLLNRNIKRLEMGRDPCATRDCD